MGDDQGWERVVKAAQGGQTDALKHVGHNGTPETHPVCQAIQARLGAGRTGKELRDEFMGPPYGWPQDAVDGALFVLDHADLIRTLGEDGKEDVAKVGEKPEQSPMQEGPSEEMGEIAKIYDLSVGRYDVAVDTGPSYTTQREETATIFIEILRAQPQAFPMIADKMFKVMNLPDAEELGERFKAMIPGQNQGPPPELMQAMEKLKSDAIQFKKEAEALKADKSGEMMKYDIDKQNEDDIKIIMRSYYLMYNKNNPKMVAEELEDLNRRTIGYVSGKVYSEVDFHMFYRKDIEDFAPAIANPMNPHVYGTRTGELKSFF
jgi:hypothetical protein